MKNWNEHENTLAPSMRVVVEYDLHDDTGPKSYPLVAGVIPANVGLLLETRGRVMSQDDLEEAVDALMPELVLAGHLVVGYMASQLDTPP